jgi:uncharacterized protein (DUF58 family)
MVLAALSGAVLTGLDTENTVSYQGYTPLIFLLVIALGWSLFFHARFSAMRLLPRFGTAGRPLHYRVMVKNQTAKAQTGLTLLDNLADPRPTFREWHAAQSAFQNGTRSFRVSQKHRTRPFRVATIKEADVPPMRPNEEVEVRIELTPLRRGVLRFASVTLARPDPFGLFRSFVKARQVQTVLVLPKRYALPPIALPGALRYQEGGVALASSIGRSDEFVSLRDYRRGDPMRHIHWKSWAKVGRPIVREFEDEFFVRHALVLDTFIENPNSEAFEEAVSVASSFACTLATQESLLDLLFVGPEAYCFTAGRGLAHADQMLEILASVRSCHDVSEFPKLEHLILEHVSSVSGCICVLVSWDETRQKLVEKIKLFGIPLFVIVIVDRGENRSLDPGPMRDYPAQFHVLEAGKVEEELMKLVA